MANDFGTLKDELENSVGRHNTEFTNMLGAFIQDTLDEIQDEMNFWFMKTTVSLAISSSDSPAQYDLDSSVKEVDEVYLVLTASNSFKKLEEVTLNDALARFSPSPTAAEPESYILENQTFTPAPPPDQAYTVYIVCWKRFDTLVDDEDINFLMSSKKKLVMDGAKKRAFAFLQEYQDAQYWKGQFEEGLQLLRREHNSRILNGEVTLVPKTDQKALINTERFSVGTRAPQGYY